MAPTALGRPEVLEGDNSEHAPGKNDAKKPLWRTMMKVLESISSTAGKAPEAACVVLLMQAGTLSQPGILNCFDDPDLFGSSYGFDLNGDFVVPPGFTPVPGEAIGRSLLLRLAFFTEAEEMLHQVAPLLLHHLWSQAQGESFVIAYPGVSRQRLIAAAEMLKAGCEAVTLRRDGEAPVIVGLSRNVRNERMVSHWAQRVEQFSWDPHEKDSIDPFLTGRMIDYLCDKVGSIRDDRRDLVPSKLMGLTGAAKVAPVIREAVRKLLPHSQELMRDPFGSAAEALNAPSSSVHQDKGSLITRLAFHIWNARADLQASFDLSKDAGRCGLADWFLDRASAEYQLGDEFLHQVRAERARRPENGSSELDTGTTENRAVPTFDRGAGVNLIGYPRAEMGMGQQLRSCAGALSAVSVRFSVVDFTFGIIASQQDSGYEHLMGIENRFAVNMFHINADQMPLAVEKLGLGFFRDHYNIGYWEWELAEFPDAWQGSIDMMDEIWAPSRFIQQAVSKKTTKPVIWMPLAVEFPRAADLSERRNTREKFGLPEMAFLFLFSFDLSSFATRKNWPACIEAFRKAFPKPDNSVGLVLKTIRHAHHDREFWRLLREIGDDPQIFLIDRILRLPEMHQLTAACDSFVSLHRSEGFGLGIAEAMYLGKPVIATNYSGNVDFTKRENACLVDYQLVPVGRDEYVCPEGQVWAEPDVDQAALQMRRLVDDPDCASELGEAAHEFVARRHNFKAVGNRYKTRLAQIAEARSLLSSFIPQVE